MLSDIYYFVDERKNKRHSAILVHALRKKTDKMPLEDFHLCLKRKRQIEENFKIEKIDL